MTTRVPGSMIGLTPVGGTSDEHRGDNLWFSQAGTLTASAGGDAGTNSIDIRLDGTYNDFTWTSEPGAGAKAYYLKATANENRLAGVFNSGTASTIEAGAAGDNLVFDRQRLDGLKRLNHLNHATDGEQDLHVFGDGTNSQGGAGRSSLRIWEANGTARNLRLGWNSRIRAMLSPNTSIRMMSQNATSSTTLDAPSAPTTSTSRASTP